MMGKSVAWVLYLFWEKRKGKWGAVVPRWTGFSSALLLVTHVEAGHCIQARLVETACELGRSTLDESPTVQEDLWPSPQRPRANHFLVSPSWDGFVKADVWWCHGLPSVRSPLKADGKGLVFKEGDSVPLGRDFFPPKLHSWHNLGTPNDCFWSLAMLPLHGLREHSRRPWPGNVTSMLGWQDSSVFWGFWLVNPQIRFLSDYWWRPQWG